MFVKMKKAGRKGCPPKSYLSRKAWDCSLFPQPVKETNRKVDRAGLFGIDQLFEIASSRLRIREQVAVKAANWAGSRTGSAL